MIGEVREGVVVVVRLKRRFLLLSSVETDVAVSLENIYCCVLWT